MLKLEKGAYMRIRTELEEKRNGCAMISRYNADTSEYLGRRVYDRNHKAIMETFNYYKAHKCLMKTAKRN